VFERRLHRKSRRRAAGFTHRRRGRDVKSFTVHTTVTFEEKGRENANDRAPGYDIHDPAFRSAVEEGRQKLGATTLDKMEHEVARIQASSAVVVHETFARSALCASPSRLCFAPRIRRPKAMVRGAERVGGAPNANMDVSPGRGARDAQGSWESGRW